jgi:hypothetical protein
VRPDIPAVPATRSRSWINSRKMPVSQSGWPAGSLAAVYDPTEEGGVAKLNSADAALAFVPYPFFVEHAAAIAFDAAGSGGRGGYSVRSSAGRWSQSPAASPGRVDGGLHLAQRRGLRPDFVRHSALEGWALPPDVKIEATGQILSALRRVAAGESVAVLLDQTQAAALPSLPFATELEVVMQSPELPVAIIAVVDSRITAARARSLQAGLLKMGHACRAAPTPWGHYVCAASCCPSCRPTPQRRDAAVVVRLADARSHRLHDAAATSGTGTKRGAALGRRTRYGNRDGCKAERS